MGGQLTFDGWPLRARVSPAARYAAAVTVAAAACAWGSVTWYGAASVAALVVSVALAAPLYRPARVTVGPDGLAYARLGRAASVPRAEIVDVRAGRGAVELSLAGGRALYIYLPPRMDWAVGTEAPEASLARRVRAALELGVAA